MSSRNYGTINKVELYKSALFLSNCAVILGATLAVTYLVIPLLGAKLSFRAIIAYASWAGIGLGLKPILRKKLEGLRVMAHEYFIACLSVIFSIIVWWRYPINIILSILVVAGFVFSYKAQNN